MDLIRPSDLINNSFSYSNVEGQTARSETDTPGSSALIETSNETASFLSQIQYFPKAFLFTWASIIRI